MEELPLAIDRFPSSGAELCCLWGENLMPLYLSAPYGRTQLGASGYCRTFQTILANGIGPDYAIYSTLTPRVQEGMPVVVFDRDRRLRAEGTLASYVARSRAGNGVQRYDLTIHNLHSVPYTAPRSVNWCGVAIV